MASAADPLARTAGPVPTRVGLVAPLPPQVGGVASVAQWLLERQDDLGVRYETFDLRRPAAEVGGRVSLGAVLRQAPQLLRFLRWLPRAPRVVHACVSCTATGLTRETLLLAALRASGRRSVAHLHGDVDAALSSRYRARMLRLIGALSAERVALSQAAEEGLASVGVSARWIPNPIRVATNGGHPREGNGPLQLILVGRYGEKKGCFELLEALARVRREGVDARLALAGREERRGQEDLLRRRVRDHGLDGVVDFVGLIDGERLRHFYESADVVCLPSKGEGVPMALLEGMAFGLPALATEVGGIPDLVEDGRSGYLVQSGDVEALAERIRLLADSDTRKRLGRGARERVRAFADGDQIAARWRELYAQLGER